MGKLSFISIFLLVFSSYFVLSTDFVYASISTENNAVETIANAQQNTTEEPGNNGPESNLGYLFAVFAIVWGMFFAFMLLLIRKQTRIHAEITSLKDLLGRFKNSDDST